MRREGSELALFASHHHLCASVAFLLWDLTLTLAV